MSKGMNDLGTSIQKLSGSGIFLGGGSTRDQIGPIRYPSNPATCQGCGSPYEINCKYCGRGADIANEK